MESSKYNRTQCLGGQSFWNTGRWMDQPK